MMTSALHVRTLQNLFKYSNQLINKSLRISPVLVSKLQKSALHSSPILPQSTHKHSGMSNNPFSGEGEPPMKKADCCFTMDISKSPIFQKIFNDELIELKRICDENEMEIRLAGGPVRDILMGVVPHDLDFATTKKPDDMKEIFTKAGVRVIDYGSRATEHGTVVVRINDKENFEITTTRSDIKTDGRHATVKFHKDWKEDANRRDLTINSMFLGLDGILYDFFNGYNDLKEKKVLFVGEAEDRITEDYLRIMRYFRFYGRIKAMPEDHDKNTLKCIEKNANGLAGVAGERIWVELKKVLTGHFADHQMRHIMELGVGKQIGLPDDSDIKRFEEVYTRTLENFKEISESALLAALLNNEEQVQTLHARLKLSKVELTTVSFIVEHRNCYKQGDTKYYKDLIMDSSDSKQCHSRCIQLAAYMADRKVIDQLTAWELPKLPFSAKFLLDLGVPKGRKIAMYVGKIRERWKETNFTASQEELQMYAEELVKKPKSSS